VDVAEGVDVNDVGIRGGEEEILEGLLLLTGLKVGRKEETYGSNDVPCVY
jgi:hypothetical protein